MKEIINEAIMSMVNDGQFSMRRLNDLIYVKEFIDRISTRNYLEEKDIESIRGKFGTHPSVQTWGDYFQTEMAASLIVLSDDEFSSVIDTLKFDMIASSIIFSEKDVPFFEWVDHAHRDIMRLKDSSFTEEEDEIIHLKILKDYYTDLGITGNFTDAEMKWYSAFNEAAAM